MASKNLQKSSAIQNNSVTLSSVIIAIVVCSSLCFNTIKFFASFKETPKFSLITKFSSTYISSNSRYNDIQKHKKNGYKSMVINIDSNDYE